MAEGDLNLATLWLPVAPETSKVGPAMEEAGKKAKSSFTQAAKGIGDTLHADLAKASSKAGDAFSGVGKRITDIFAKAGSDSGKAMVDGLAKVPGAEKVTEPFRQLVTTANDASTSVRDLGNAFGDLKRGDVSGFLDRANSSIQGIDKNAKNVGIDISEWAGPLDNVTEPLGKASDTANSLGGHINEATGAIGRLGESGGGLGGLIGKLGEVGIAIEAVRQGLNDIEAADHWLENKMPWYKNLDEQFKNNPINSFFNRITGGGGGRKEPDSTTPYFDAQGRPLTAAGTPFGSSTGGGFGGSNGIEPYPENFVGPLPPGAVRGPNGVAPPGLEPKQRSFYHDWYGSQPSEPDETPPAPTRSSGGGRGSSYTKPSIGSVSSRAGLVAAGSRVANLFAFAHSLVGTPYSQELRNDCSGMVSQLAAVAVGMAPPSAGERFTTPSEGAWLFSHGFEPGLGGPNDLNIGWNPAPGNSGHTAATLPGGVNAESGGSHGSFLLGPGAAGATDPFFTQHAHLSMGKGGGSSGQGSPLGSKSDPLYVSSADGGSGSGGSSGPWESQGQQLAQGMVNGVAEMFGVDGSVFKGFGSGKGLLDFGAFKLGGGLLNWGMQLAQARGGGATGGLPVSGGDGASIPGLGMLSGLGNLIPTGHGPAMSGHAVAAPGAGLSQDGGGTTVNIHGDVNSGFNVTQNGIKDGVGSWKEQYNSQPNRAAPLVVPNAGGLPAG